MRTTAATPTTTITRSTDMAMYRCNECDMFVDDDWNPCEEDPRPGQELELLCPDCAEEIIEEDEE